MNNFDYIINYFTTKLQIYKYDLSQKRFILTKTSSHHLYPVMFDDMKIIDTIFKYHNINYIFDHDDYSISIEKSRDIKG